LPVAEVYLPKGTVAVAASTDALWVTSDAASRLARVNPHNNELVEEIVVGSRPRRLAVGEGAVWTLNGDGTVSRVDPATSKVAATIKVGRETTGGDIAAGAGSVWVSVPGTPIVRIDPRTNRAVQAFTGDGGGAILVAHGSVWVSAGSQTWRLDPRLVESVRP
jgi:DNA-binding beta-propeller fold protein YncE